MKNIYKDVEAVLEKYQNIGIMISGGLDSTVLAYLLFDIRNKTNRKNKLSLFVVPRPDDSHHHALRVAKYLENTFGVSISLTVVGTGDVHHTKQVTSGLKEAVENYDCDVYVTAITTNPEDADPPEKLANYRYGAFVDEKGVPYNGPKRIKSWSPKVFDVFWDYTKEDTVRVVKEMGLTDIPNITHTCTGSKSLRCGQCWQCCERAWGFQKNNYEDTGTM
jgi:hypothetical protein